MIGKLMLVTMILGRAQAELMADYMHELKLMPLACYHLAKKLGMVP